MGLLDTYLFGVADGFSYSLLRTLLYAILIVPTTELFNQKTNYKPLFLEVLGLVYSLFPVLKIKHNDLYQQFLRKEKIDQSNIKLDINDEDYRYNHSIIISKLISLNNDLHKENKSSSSYTIGKDEGYRDTSVTLIELLDASRSNFVFLQQIEFVNNFILPE